MDAEAKGGARHVGPPRTLDVHKFAAARATEVASLYKAIAGKSASGESSSLLTPRHLRRRTGSHNRRRQFLWTQTKKKRGLKKPASYSSTSSVGQGNAASSAAAVAKSNAASSSAAAAEQNNASAVDTLGQNDGAAAASEGEPSRKRKPEKRPLSRLVRRRIELRAVREGKDILMRDGTRRLPTHVWHAKRFRMAKAWGYCLPQGLPGRGRGSKAVYKWVKNAAVLHDASYMGLVELQGTTEAIREVLIEVLEPPPGPLVSASEPKRKEIYGLLYGNAVLHSVGSAPHDAIAPVTFLWRPLSGGVTSELSAEEIAREERQLWIWVHPSAYELALQILSTACKPQGQETGQAAVRCQSRRGELARLDLLGNKALQVLEKVLRPVPRPVAKPSKEEVVEHFGHQYVTDKCAPSSDVIQSLKARIFAKADGLPGQSVLALDVYDPRDTPRSFYSVKGCNSLHTRLPHDAEVQAGNAMQSGGDLVDGIRKFTESENHVNMEEKHPGRTGYQENLGQSSLLDEELQMSSLWLPPPAGSKDRKAVALSQKAFSDKRHKRRIAFYRDVDTNVLHYNSGAGAEEGVHEESRVCPVVLVKQSHLSPSSSGWSLIMPIGWVHAFWVPLVFAGGHVIGLRECHWLATDAGTPFFPHDFPDCPAYAQHLVSESTAFDIANNRRPPSKRAPPFEVSPLQRSILKVYKSYFMQGSVENSAVTAKPTVGGDSGQYPVERCTTGDTGNTSGASEITIPNNTVVTEGNTSILLCTTPGSLNSANRAGDPGSRNQDRDTKMTETGDAVPEVASLQPGTSGLTILNNSAVDEGNTLIGLYQSLENSDTAGDPDFRNQGGDVKMSDTKSAIPGMAILGAVTCEFMTLDNTAWTKASAPIVLCSSEVSLDSSDRPSDCESKSEDGDTKMSDTGNAAPGLASLQSGTSEFMMIENTAGTEARDPIVPYPSQADLDGADRLEVPELSNQDRDTMSTDTVTAVPGLAILPQIILADTFGGHFATREDQIVVTVMHCPPVTSQPQQGISNACESQHDDVVKSAVAVEVSAPEETSVNEPIKSHNFQAPEIERSFDNNESAELPPNYADHDCSGVPAIKYTTDVETCALSFFVVRSMDTLMKTLRESGSLHILIQSPHLKHKGNARYGLREGRLEWRASHELVEPVLGTRSNQIFATVGGHVRTCYVRVLLVTPRKGAMRENDFLLAPIKEDFDAYLSRSQRWQGVETSWVLQDRRKKKPKGKKRVKFDDCLPADDNNGDGYPADLVKGIDDGGYEECCNRETIGLLTSAGPQGSLWSGTGICCVGRLLKLRAMQWADSRWWSSSEILLLAGKKSSPRLRPVLVSIALESGEG